MRTARDSGTLTSCDRLRRETLSSRFAVAVKQSSYGLSRTEGDDERPNLTPVRSHVNRPRPNGRLGAGLLARHFHFWKVISPDSTLHRSSSVASDTRNEPCVGATASLRTPCNSSVEVGPAT